MTSADSQGKEVAVSSTELTVIERAAVALKSEDVSKRLSELAAKSSGIVTITNIAGYQECHSSRMVLKNERIAIEKDAKKAREYATQFSKAVIAEENRLIGIVSSEEDRLKKIQDDWDAARLAEKEAKERAERERVEAENAAKKAAEEARLAAERAELDRQRAELAKAEEARKVAEAESQRRIADAERVAREALRAEENRLAEERRKLEAERRQAEDAARALRLEQEAVDRAKRMQAEQEQRQRDLEEVARLEAIAAKERADREAVEAKQREAQKAAERVADARDMLELFVDRFGDIEAYAKVTKAIRAFLGGK